MTQYIDKSALVAEIEKWISGWTERLNNTNPSNPSFFEGGIEVGKHILTFLDTLKVKEVQKEPVSEQNLSNVERTTKNWKEPISESLEEVSKEWLRPQLDKSYANYGETKMMELTHFDGYAMLDAIDFGAKWQKTKDESTTEDLGEYINELSKQFPEVSFAKLSRIAVRVAKWQKENLWKPADGNDLPEYDREVVVLIQPYPLENSEYAVSFAHRPNPNGWDGKSITTGKVEHYTPKTYGKGGWNIPDVVLWLDYDINELLCREK